MSSPVLRHLAAALAAELALGARGPWVLAFSGGVDSTALALALAELAPKHDLPIELLHVDHALDSGSGERALAAAALAAGIGLPFTCERHPVSPERQRREGTEAAARRVRYAALEAFRVRIGGDRILTAHHRDDQIETVLLRLAAGSGLFGLAGIQPWRGPILRPLLELGRSELAEVVAAGGLSALDDPTNRELSCERNRLRHRLLPHLLLLEPGLGSALAAVAAAAARARSALAQRLEKLLLKEGGDSGPQLEVAALLSLPEPVALLALDLLERLVGRERPGSTRSKRELLRQLSCSHDGSLDLQAAGGERLVWRAAGGYLTLGPPVPAVAAFSYILRLPGEVEIPELQSRIRLSRQPVAPWMRVGEARRAALEFPDADSARVEIRNRRHGDRIRSLGAPGMRRLKELLIDRKVPCAERDSIPLLLVEGAIAWVPGIAIADRFRLAEASAVWVAEWIDNPTTGFRRRTIEEVPAVDREEY